MTKLPLVRNPTADGLQEVQLSSSDLSDGPFVTGNGAIPFSLSNDLTVVTGFSYVVANPMVTNGHIITVESGAVLGVVLA